MLRVDSSRLGFRKIKTELEDVFQDDVKIVGESTPTITGWLEVQVVGGPLLHSKKNGDGYVDSKQKMDRIVQGIEAELKK
ncbi:SELENOW [Branchiostoma lanceolatum]|uniref:SELENOW protein n=1 Tax=Branchiostoma lanceolatum TaxID=7740 RepID=A0A8J9ZUI1_BRALA|nr:SELENOW [Branchiostoma lanceolatum]